MRHPARAVLCTIFAVLTAVSLLGGLPLLAGAVDAGAGDPDTSFGAGGARTFDIMGVDRLAKVLRQPDGKIVMAGTVGDNNGGDPDFNGDDIDRLAVARLGLDNTLDPTFSPGTHPDYTAPPDAEPANGVFVLPKSTLGVSTARSIGSAAALDGAGRIVVVGHVTDTIGGLGQQALVVRLTPQGNLDSSFGGNGFVLLALPGTRTIGMSVAIDGDRIVIGGEVLQSNVSKPFVARYLTNGTLDPSFQRDEATVGSQPGISYVAPTGSVSALAIDASRNVLVGGGGTNRSGFVTRLHGTSGAGQIDTAFAGDGSHDLAAAAISAFSDIRTTPSGGIIAAGYRGIAVDGIQYQSHVVHLLPSGFGDPGFGSSGSVRDESVGGSAVPTSVILDGEGRTYVSFQGIDGAGATDVHVVRYLADGRRDAAWGLDGVGVTTLTPAGAGVPDNAANLVGLPDGKVLVGASAIQWSVVRLKGDGTFPTFDRGDIDTLLGGPPQGEPDNVPMDADDVIVTANGTTYVSSLNTHLVFKVTGNYGNGSAIPVLGDGRDCTNCALASDFPRLGSATPISAPQALAYDEERKVLFVGTQVGALFAVDEAGVATKLMSGANFDSGDGGPGSSAVNNSVYALHFDPAARLLYIASGFNGSRIRVVPVDAQDGTLGTITLLANASLSRGFAGDGGPASAALLDAIRDILVDPATGDLYATTLGDHRVRRIEAGGDGVAGPNDTITTAVGNGGTFHTGNSGPATSVALPSPSGLARTPDGRILISREDRRITAFDPAAGTVSLFAGNGTSGESNGPLVTFLSPTGLAIGPSADIFVADNAANLVRRIDTGGAFASRVAGFGRESRSGSASHRDNPDDAASLNLPSGLAIRRNATNENELWVSEGGVGGAGPSTINRLSAAGSYDPMDSTGLSGPREIEWSEFHQRFIIANSSSAQVFAYDPSSDNTVVVAGTGSAGSADGPALSASFARVLDVAVDGDGNIYVADDLNHKVRLISGWSPLSFGSGAVSTYVGTGAPGSSPDGTPQSSAAVTLPSSVHVDPTRGVLITENNRIRNVYRAEGRNVNVVLGTVAGNGNFGDFAVDGQPANTQGIGNPTGMVNDRAGNLYFGTIAGRVYSVDNAGILHFVSGRSSDNLANGDLGPALAGRMIFAHDVALDEDAGILYISDPRENLVRKVRLLPRAVPAAKGPGKIAYSQQGLNLDVFVANADFTGPLNVTPGMQGNQTDPELSPDGNRIVYVSTHTGDVDVWVADADGTDAYSVSDSVGSWEADPTWVDNDTIAYVSDLASSDFDLYRRDAPRPRPAILPPAVRLTTTPTINEGYPDFSAEDGQYVVRGTHLIDGDTDIYKIPAAGGTPTMFVGTAGPDAITEDAPAYSPDGQSVVFSRNALGSKFIVIAPDTQITSDTTKQDNYPQFTPDGRQVVFESLHGIPDVHALDIVNVDGTNRQNLTTQGVPGGPNIVNTTQVGPLLPGLPATPARVPLSAIPMQPSGAAGEPATVGATGTINLSNLLKLPVDLSNLLKLPVDLSNLLKLPVDLSNLLKLPVDLSNLLKLPVDLSNLLKLPVDLSNLLKLPGVQAALSTPISAMPPQQIWDEILDGTEFASRPRQTVTLKDILSNPTTRARFEEHSLFEFNFLNTPFHRMTLEAFSFGALPIRALGIPEAELESYFAAQGHPNFIVSKPGEPVVDGRNLSIFDLQLAGFDLNPLRIPGRAWKGIDFAQVPAGKSVPILRTKLSKRHGGVDLEDADIGTIRVSQLGAAKDAIVDCSVVTANFNCTAADSPTLAQAQEANAIRETATLNDLDPVMDITDIGGRPLPIAQIVTMLVNWDALSLSSIPVDQLGVLHINEDSETQAASMSYAPAGIDFVEDPVVTIVLPPGTSFSSADLVEPTGADYTTEVTGTESSGQTITVRFPPSPTGDPLIINAGEVLRVTVYYQVGLRMGPVRLPSIDVAAAGAHQRDLNVSPNRVVDNLFDTGPALADAEEIVPTIRAATGNEVQEGELAFVFLEDKTDDQLLRIPAPPGGSILSVDVEHLPVDVDVALYQPAASGALAPVRPFAAGAPVVNPLPDQPPVIVRKGNVTAPDAQQEFPFLLTDRVVAGFSNKRGTADESVEVTAVDGATGDYVLQISGYQGAHSNLPVTVRASVLLSGEVGECGARAFPHPLDNSLIGPEPTTVPAGRESLILTNFSRIARLHGGAELTRFTTALNDLAAEVNGYVLSVDRFSAVRTAYDTWDATGRRCDPLAANGVVRAINTAVDNLFGPARSSLRYINLVGSDDVLPATRSFDFTQKVNENSFVEGASPDGLANPISGSFAKGYLLTDDGYADFGPEPWLGSALYLPDVAIGRLVETPDQISGAVERAVASDLKLNPTTAYTSGYDFFDDFATQVDQALGEIPGIGTRSSNVNSGDAAAALAALPVGVAAINGHGQPTSIETFAGDHVTAAALSAEALAGTLIFSIACHGGLNLPDATVGATTTHDLTQAASAAGASGFVGNSGYGLALKNGVGLSERIYLDFAKNLKHVDVGTALSFAKQQYRASETIDNVFAAKALQIAGLSGIPQLKFEQASGVISTPTSSRPAAYDPNLGMNVETVSVGGAAYTAGFNRNSVGSSPAEIYYDHSGRTSRLVGQPIQPVYSEPVRPGGTDALITGLTTEVRPGDGLINPLLHNVVVTGQGDLREPEPESGSTTADFASVRQFKAPDGDRAQLNLIAGQFTSAGLDPATGQAVGRQRLVSSATVKAIDNGPADGKRPIIAYSDGVIVNTTGGGKAASFVVDTWDPRPGDTRAPVQGVLVLSLNKAANGNGAWTVTRLAPSPTEPFRWSGAVPTSPTAAEIEYFVQAWDGQLVGRSDFKDAYYLAEIAPQPPVSILTATVAGTPAPAGNGYLLSATVTLSPATDAEYRIDDGPWTPYEAPFTITEDGSHRVGYRNGLTMLETVVLVDHTAPTVVVAPGGATYELNEPVPTAQLVACHDAGAGVSSCSVSPTALDTGAAGGVDRTATLTVTATDAAGHVRTQDVTYAYRVNVAPVLTVTGTTVVVAGSPIYKDAATFTVEPAAQATLSVDGGTPFAYTGPFTLTLDGEHTVTAANPSGISDTEIVTIDSLDPSTVVAPGGATYDIGQNVATASLVTCTDPTSGITRCDVSPATIDTSASGPVARTATITVVAKDGVGHEVTRQLTYDYFVRIPPALTISGSTIGSVYIDQATATVTPPSGATIKVDAGAAVPYTGPVVVTGDGDHTVVATNPAGSDTKTFTIDANAPTATPAAPATFILNATVSTAGRAVCTDRLAVTRCEVIAPATLNTSGVGPRSTTLTVITTDAAGHTATRSVVYSYAVVYVFELRQPLTNIPLVNNTPILTQPLPVKFKLKDASGASVGGANVGVTRNDAACWSGPRNVILVALLYDPLIILQPAGTTIYQADAGTYRYRLDASLFRAGQCTRMMINPGDGTSYEVRLEFRLL